MSQAQPPIPIPTHSNFEDGLKVDVAIIGAGCSGLYTGYRLLKDKFAQGSTPTPTVHIFELSDRVGGRLESVTLPGMGNVTGELGGMRYMTSQRIVTSLIEEVFKDQLTSIDFPMGNPEYLKMYLRKQRFQADAWEKAQSQGKEFKTNYCLKNEDIGYSADQLFNKIVYDVLIKDPGLDPEYKKKISHSKKYQYEFKLTRKDWDDIKPKLKYCFEDSPYNQMLVNDIGFWNLIKDRVSQEGYQFLSDAGGYYSNTINWNAAEAFPYMVGDFSDTTVTYKTIEGGYDRIARALAKAYADQPGSTIWVKNALVSFDRVTLEDYRYGLTMYNIESAKEWKVFANKIVLAIPRRSLELLNQYNFFFDPEKNQNIKTNIQSVFLEPSYKLLLGFEDPWWQKDFCIKSGHSITDLPMRQCYYFGVNPENEHSLLLASYNDMETVPFWNILEKEKLQFDQLNSLLLKQGKPLIFRLLKQDEIVKKHPEIKIEMNKKFKPREIKSVLQQELNKFEDVQASQVMVDEVMNQIKELHCRDDISDPYISYYKDWSEDPFGGGYHAWQAKIDVQGVMEYMRQPMKQEDIHICSEAYSDQQGWVEGALCVAEKMLQDHFSMKCPEWLDPPDYYLGW